MSDTLFREISFRVEGLLHAVGHGNIGLPDIQRPFVWPNTKVRDLFDSMYRGYPVGYLLLWENAAVDGTRAIGSESKQVSPQLLIIDGQQRLTSLYAVMRGIPVLRENFQHERIQIAFCPLDGSFEVADAAIRKDPRWLPDIAEIWKPDKGLFEILRQYLGAMGAENGGVSDADRHRIEKAIHRLANLNQFPFTALQLAANTDEEQVADIFVRVNSKGKQLNQADFILTLMSVFRDQKRTQLEDFCRRSRVPPTAGRPSPFNHFLHPDPDQLLRVAVALGFRRARLQHVYSILCGKDLETGDYSVERREQQFVRLDAAQEDALDLNHWHDFMRCLLRAGFRTGSTVSSKNALLYSYAFYLLGKREFGVRHHPLHRAIARWFFFVALTGRYTESPESRMEQDLADLRGLHTADEFLAHLDRTIDAVFTADYWRITLPSELATSSARSPALFGYYAALNLLDARVLFSDLRVAELLDPATCGPRKALERHHLFPKAYLQRSGVGSRRETNQIANYALVEWPDNAEIGARPPREYFPPLLDERYGQNPERLREMRFWHALPEGWEQSEYPRFLEERRRGMAEVIRAGFEALGRLTVDEAEPSPVPTAERPSGTAAERLLLTVPGAARTRLEELLAEPSVPVNRLAAEVHGYVAKLASLHRGGEPVDLDTARRLSDRCVRLLERAAASDFEEAGKLAQAATQYLVLEEDAQPDLGEAGFRDDELVIAAVESLLAGLSAQM